jgi:hypothetical protein
MTQTDDFMVVIKLEHHPVNGIVSFNNQPLKILSTPVHGGETAMRPVIRN